MPVPRSRSLPRIAVVVTLALATAACGDDRPMRMAEAPQAPGTIEINGEEATDRGTHSVNAFEQVALVAGDFHFQPTLVIGPPGLEIELDVSTSSPETHNLSIPEQGIDLDVAGGRVVAQRVSFPRSGTVVFFCKYHRERGMLGGLTAA